MERRSLVRLDSRYLIVGDFIRFVNLGLPSSHLLMDHCDHCWKARLSLSTPPPGSPHTGQWSRLPYRVIHVIHLHPRLD